MPVIGILTQPVADKNKPYFPYEQYVLDINKDFVQWGGSYAVPVPFDISDDELYGLLD
jgi:hypothetical protein